MCLQSWTKNFMEEGAYNRKTIKYNVNITLPWLTSKRLLTTVIHTKTCLILCLRFDVFVVSYLFQVCYESNCWIFHNTTLLLLPELLPTPPSYSQRISRISYHGGSVSRRLNFSLRLWHFKNVVDRLSGMC